MQTCTHITHNYSQTHNEVALLSGAQILFETLLKHNVTKIFGYPGGAIMPIYDALTQYPQIKHILTRHEQGAIHAAQGYARITHTPGVVFATSGPGATNLVTGLADALMDSTPIIAITGQVMSLLLGSDAFQEIDVVGTTAAVTKYNILITKAEQIEQAVHEAFRIATTKRPGPVLIDITKDAQIEKYEYTQKYHYIKKTIWDKIDEKKIKATIDKINKAQKPLILAGHGIILAQATNELYEFVTKTNIPIACTLHGLTSFPADHKLYIGMLGMHGNYAPNLASGETDLIIALGMRFDDRVTGKVKNYAPKAKIIHVEIAQEEINKNVQTTINFNTDVKQWLKTINQYIQKPIKLKKQWMNQLQKWQQQEIIHIIEKEKTKPKLNCAQVIHEITKQTKGSAIVVADVGQHQMFTARYYKAKNPNSFITSGGAGTMGFALPAAIGVKIGAPEQEIWVIVGDGAFQMTLQELGVIMQENLNIKIAIINNNFLGMVRQWQELFFEKNYSQTPMVNPNFTLLGEAYGIKSKKAETYTQAQEAIKVAREHAGPYIIEFITEKEETVFPMIEPGKTAHEMRLN